jgi:class 3 adenylate cyclase
VNLANRLEAYGKEVWSESAGVAILISEATRALLGPGWQVEDLGRHQMRGRSGAIGVFRLLAEPAHVGETAEED